MLLNVFAAVVIVALAGALWFYDRQRVGLQRLNEELSKQREAALDLLNRIGLRINSSLDLDGALETIAEYIVESSYAESGAIFLLDADGKALQARTVIGLFPPMHQTANYILTKQRYLAEKIKRDKIGVGEGIIGFVARTGEAVLITDALSDPRVPRIATDFVQIRSMMVSPLRIRQKVVGVFAVVNRTREGAFGEADLRLLDQLSAQAALTVDIVRLYEHQAAQRRIAQELQLAKEFQRMLLPATLPQAPGMDLAAFSNPAMEVGGDYYDLFWVEPGVLLGVAIVDVAGKGISGALVMAIVRSALKAEAKGSDSPREVLLRLNHRILEDTRDSTFVTLAYGIIDLRTGRLRFARAGHEPLLLFSEGEPHPRILMPEGIALGLVEDAMFQILQESEAVLQPGDTLVLYTDGVIEAINGREEDFGADRFHESVRGRMGAPAAEIVDGVLADINQFTGGIAQQDDITLVVVRMLPHELPAPAPGGE